MVGPLFLLKDRVNMVWMKLPKYQCNNWCIWIQVLSTARVWCSKHHAAAIGIMLHIYRSSVVILLHEVSTVVSTTSKFLVLHNLILGPSTLCPSSRCVAICLLVSLCSSCQALGSLQAFSDNAVHPFSGQGITSKSRQLSASPHTHLSWYEELFVSLQGPSPPAPYPRTGWTHFTDLTLRQCQTKPSDYTGSVRWFTLPIWRLEYSRMLVIISSHCSYF